MRDGHSVARENPNMDSDVSDISAGDYTKNLSGFATNKDSPSIPRKTSFTQLNVFSSE
jgi:hypothetical protein